MYWVMHVKGSLVLQSRRKKVMTVRLIFISISRMEAHAFPRASYRKTCSVPTYVFPGSDQQNLKSHWRIHLHLQVVALQDR
jgi:hypothetical protein